MKSCKDLKTTKRNEEIREKNGSNTNNFGKTGKQHVEMVWIHSKQKDKRWPENNDLVTARRQWGRPEVQWEKEFERVKKQRTLHLTTQQTNNYRN